MKRNGGARRAWELVWVHAAVWLFVLFAIFPILQIVGISLRPGDQLYSTDLRLIPDDATLDALTLKPPDSCDVGVTP